MQEALKDYPVIIDIKVAWGEMDSFQHVNNVVYFRYFESCRIAYMERVKVFEYMEATGIGPILASCRCKFRRPLTYPDSISVGSKVTEIGRDRFLMEHRIFSHGLSAIAAEGDGVVVAYDYRKNHKVAIPSDWKQKILELEQNGLVGFTQR